MDILPADDAGLDDFRLRSPLEIRALLARLLDASALLHLSTPDGASYTTTLGVVDGVRGIASFHADAASPQLQRVLASSEITAVGYLDCVRLQFELLGPMLVNGARSSALQARLPRELFRFQRRQAFRVRPLSGSAPTVTLPHPACPELALALRLLDVSAGGCALFVPDALPPLAPGRRIRDVLVELDAETCFSAALMPHYVTAMNPDSGGARLGCEWIDLAPDAQRRLQRFIDRVQKERRAS